MNVERIVVDKSKARELYQEYKKHQHYSAPIDEEIQRTYKVLAQGRTVIQAIKSIEAAGLGADKMPKLAIARADASQCFWRTFNNHGMFHSEDRWSKSRTKIVRANFPDMTYQHPEGRAVVPLIPVHLRPKRGLANYHILWEADWKAIPKDPYLLRRIGGDLWLVVARMGSDRGRARSDGDARQRMRDVPLEKARVRVYAPKVCPQCLGLTEAQVIEIRSAQGTATQRVIADKYGSRRALLPLSTSAGAGNIYEQWRRFHR